MFCLMICRAYSCKSLTAQKLLPDSLQLNCTLNASQCIPFLVHSLHCCKHIAGLSQLHQMCTQRNGDSHNVIHYVNPHESRQQEAHSNLNSPAAMSHHICALSFCMHAFVRGQCCRNRADKQQGRCAFRSTLRLPKLSVLDEFRGPTLM